jgi:flagellar FliL protein
MPVEEQKTTVESSAQQAGEPKKGMNKLILFGGIGGGAAILGVALAWFVVKPMLSPAELTSETTESAESHDASKSHDEPKEEHESEGEGEHGGGEGSSIYTIKDLVVNPSGTAGSRYLSASIAFQLGSPEEAAKFEQLEPIIRDALITILSSKTVAQLTDSREKEIARVQIKNRVAQLLKNSELAGVYYSDFVLQ